LRYATLILAVAGLTSLSACRGDLSETTTGLEGCWNVHEHTYTHQWSFNEGYETYAWVRGARVYLHDDLLDVADMDRLACPDLDAPDDADPEDTWTEDCTSKVTYDMHGTTEVSLVRGDADALYPDYIQYRFGVDSEYDALYIAGPNDTDRDGAIDTSEEDANIAVQIGWEPIGTGTGTTSADFMVDYWIYDQGCADAADVIDGELDDGHCWSQTDEPQNPSVIGEHWSPESDVVARSDSDCIESE